ncbi:MAG: hypothetical protein ACO3VI_10560 [Ilumatobacteraceae bacterium]
MDAAVQRNVEVAFQRSCRLVSRTCLQKASAIVSADHESAGIGAMNGLLVTAMVS